MDRCYSTKKMVIWLTAIIVIPFWSLLFIMYWFNLSWLFFFFFYLTQIGICIRELNFKSLGRYLSEPNSERDKHWPAFCRLDMHNWRYSDLKWGVWIFFARGPMTIIYMCMIAFFSLLL